MVSRIDLRLVAVAIGFAASACVAPEELEEERANIDSSIVGGREDRGHPAVGMLAVDPDGDGRASGFCTGTLIAPTKVLTAAHCVDQHRSARRLYVVFAPSSVEARPSDVFRVANVAVHPDYRANGNFPNDVAILTLESAPRGIQPMPIAREPITAVGATITHVGFGHSSATSQQDRTGLGTKRVISTPLLRVDETKLVTGRALCYGDSGGPALMDVRGVTRVVGVHSYITNTSCNSPSNQGASQRLDRVLSFIDANVGGMPGGDAPGVDPPGVPGGSVRGTVTAMGYGANVRAEPNTSSRVVTVVPDGTVLTITCQARGERVAGTDVWSYIGDRGGWVLDQLLDTGVDGFHPNVPRCR